LEIGASEASPWELTPAPLGEAAGGAVHARFSTTHSNLLPAPRRQPYSPGMKSLGLLALLVYTFGALTYGSILVLWVREMGRLGWAARTGREGACEGGPHREVDGVNGALLVVTFLWFCGNVIEVLYTFGRDRSVWLQVGLALLAYAFPPIIMHLTLAESQRERRLPRAWHAALLPAYLLCVAVPIVGLAVMAEWPDTAAAVVAGRVMTAGLSVAFVGAAAYSAMLVARYGDVRDARQVASRRWLLRMFGFMSVLFVLMFFLNSGRGPDVSRYLAGALEISAKSLPLIFMFVGTYYENRFQFFDLLVKRGAALLITLGGLTLWFAGVLPPLSRSFDRQWAAPWLYAVALLPVVGALPWLYARIAATLDRRWLGRRYTTVEAVKRFLSGLRSATTEAELVEQAQRGLTEIFDAPALVQIGAAAPPADFVAHQRVDVRAADDTLGAILMGRRTTDAPYFSGDVALLSSLADVFGSVMQNLQLQERKLEHEQRARELSLHASRSELKALRAQINPHFLFNALNSIAGLIHRDPAVADRTIEQLADVFRYALRGAESEWAVLDDELEFVRAYLEVERARFGDRLQVVVDQAESTRGARVPTMIVQTLVENAVKHGVASVRGPALVEVRATGEDGRLHLAVCDNGPGFGDAPAATRPGAGYGLVNIRQRLDGYFRGNASLTTGRDSARDVTIVSISLPLLRAEPKQPPVAMEHAR
jgi:signal transduction histidine kinase